MEQQDASPSRHMRDVGIDVRPIPRLDGATISDLHRAVGSRSGPILLGGLCKGWPAFTAWTAANLRAKYGGTRVVALMNLPGSGVLFPKDQHEYERELDFRDFIDAMLGAQPTAPCYLAHQKADQLFDPSDYDFATMTGLDGGETRAWIGSAGTRSMFHSDLKDNLFCQIWGTKSVTLLPWIETAAAYPQIDNIVNSQVDLAAPDIDRFPRLLKASFYSSIVQPGDVLYIPRGCWHDIRACSPSVSLNHWFGPGMPVSEYMQILARLGPRYWVQTVRDAFMHGLFARPEHTRFFFSPPSTGRRLYQALRGKGFSVENDPEFESRR